MKTNTKEISMNLVDVTGGICNRNTPRAIKMEVLENTINMERYDFLGFAANGSIVRLKPRFHNIRDKKGRFTCRRAR